MPFRVRTDIKAARKRVKRWQRRQIPFAASQALNDTAFDVRKFVVTTLYPRSFRNSRNKRFANVAFRVERSSKRRLRSRVFDRLNRFFLPQQERGGTRKPHKSVRLAVPVQAQKTASGKPYAAERPLKSGEKQRGKVYRAGANGEYIFMAVTGRGPGRSRLLYVEKNSTPVPARFPLTRLGEAKGRQVWPRHFRVRTERALRTARRRR